MRVSRNWLREFVTFADDQLDWLAQGLTLQGVSVEEIEYPGKEIRGVVCGRIQGIEPHPDADRLQICNVDIGGSTVTIVTGAPNTRKGALVAVALDGAVLPGGRSIEETSLRGVISQGMLCSAVELGLENEGTGGILIFEEGGIAPGQDIRQHLGLDDAVLVLELTPNYAAHCQSIYGVACEAAALLGGKAEKPEVKVKENPDVECAGWVDVSVKAPNGCPRYVARLIEDVRIGPSPEWMRRRLISAGMRPVNNVVDITNYVMLEYGQPLHAFDFDKLHDGRMVVRWAQDGEKILALDGRERELNSTDLVIANGDGPVAIAGVMGGKESEVDEQTTRILLESASFDAMCVSRTSRRLGLRTEASARYEKGSDPNLCAYVADRVADLLHQLAGGKVAAGRVDVYPDPALEERVQVRLERVSHLLGIELDAAAVRELLQRLQIRVVEESAGSLLVEIPTRRTDLTMEVDILEEIARIYGYNRIPSRAPAGEVKPDFDMRRFLVEEIRDFWSMMGFAEAINLPFVDPQSADDWQWDGNDPRRAMIRLANPLIKDQSAVRTSLIPNLMNALSNNLRHGERNVALFELSRVYLAGSQPLEHLPREPLRLCAAMSGDWLPASWSSQAQPADFFLLKGFIEQMACRFGMEISLEEVEEPGFHPGRTAVIKTAGRDGNDRQLGILGEIHPRILERLGIEQAVQLADLDVEVLLECAQQEPVYERLPRFPSVQRDLSFVMDESVAINEIEKAIVQAAGGCLAGVTVFDVYRDDRLGKDKRSLAYRLVYRAPDRTLRDEEVEELQERVRQELVAKFGAVLRS